MSNKLPLITIIVRFGDQKKREKSRVMWAGERGEKGRNVACRKQLLEQKRKKIGQENQVIRRAFLYISPWQCTIME